MLFSTCWIPGDWGLGVRGGGFVFHLLWECVLLCSASLSARVRLQLWGQLTGWLMQAATFLLSLPHWVSLHHISVSVCFPTWKKPALNLSVFTTHELIYGHKQIKSSVGTILFHFRTKRGSSLSHILWHFLTTALMRGQPHIKIVAWELQSGPGTSDPCDFRCVKLKTEFQKKAFSSDILIPIPVNV